jgi:glycerol-3-phosphate acyltransferase PlsY
MKLILILLYVASYICGGIPFGVVIAKLKGVDLLAVGSGNIGATNVKRALGTRFALLVFLLDVFKSTGPALVARIVVTQPYHGIPSQVFWFLAGLIAIFGHCVSPFLHFKGGKGVSTALGMVIGAAPTVAICCFSLFLVILFTTRYMSLASMVGVSSAIVFGWILPQQARELVPMYILLSVFVVYRHRQNIERLRLGTEPKFKLKETNTESEGPKASSESAL